MEPIITKTHSWDPCKFPCGLKMVYFGDLGLNVHCYCRCRHVKQIMPCTLGVSLGILWSIWVSEIYCKCYYSLDGEMEWQCLVDMTNSWILKCSYVFEVELISDAFFIALFWHRIWLVSTFCYICDYCIYWLVIADLLCGLHLGHSYPIPIVQLTLDWFLHSSLLPHPKNPQMNQ